MLIRHLALNVRDPEASVEFYRSVIGLDGEPREQPWGYRLDLPDGFMLAFIRGEPLPANAADAVHFGCALTSRELAHQVRARLQAAGATELEWEDVDDYTGVKVQDPDGYVVELSYDIG